MSTEALPRPSLDAFPAAGPWPKARVLLVDDDPIVLASLEEMLRETDVVLDFASSGDGAIECLAREAYHAVVSDISMPGMDGLELLRAIRARDPDTLVILMTGTPTVERAISAVENGATSFLLKPVDAPKLVAAIEQSVNLYRIAVLKRRALEHLRSHRPSSDRVGLDVMFQAALDGLRIVYQPIVRWSAKKVAGYEALVRSDASFLAQPGAIFDVAERVGRLADLGRRIRRLAPVPFSNGAKDDALLFLNLHVRDLLDESLFDPEHPLSEMASSVVLEITERAALEHVEDARHRVARLREMGFRIAVDDLGAGYAGLNSFVLLEPDVVKLDTALVRGLDVSRTKQRLVRSMTAVCRDMGLTVVAEGIETTGERDAAVELGCDLLQGYLFAMPGPAFPSVAW